jgi:hypothetical protein
MNLSVIPAKAGIQVLNLAPRFHGGDESCYDISPNSY